MGRRYGQGWVGGQQLAFAGRWRDPGASAQRNGRGQQPYGNRESWQHHPVERLDQLFEDRAIGNEGFVSKRNDTIPGPLRKIVQRGRYAGFPLMRAHG